MKFQRGKAIEPKLPPLNGLPPGAKHGADTAVRLYRERELDLRRNDHRFIDNWKKSVIDDLGGPKEVSVFQVAMVDQAVAIMIILNAMQKYIEEHGIMDGKELTACLRSSYITYSNSLRHTLESAYGVSAIKKGKKVPNLRDYLKDAIEKEEPENGGTEERDGETPGRRQFYESGSGKTGGAAEA